MKPRTHRYRATRKSDGVQITGEHWTKFLGGTECHYIKVHEEPCAKMYEVSQSSLQRSTGLHDIRGVEIFEGDKVAPYGSDAENLFVGEIVKDGGELMLKCRLGLYDITQTFFELFEVMQ